jgi:hypothetical protein
MTFNARILLIAIPLAAQIVAATSAHAADPLGRAGMQTAPRDVVPMMQTETLPTFGETGFGMMDDGPMPLG